MRVSMLGSPSSAALMVAGLSEIPADVEVRRGMVYGRADGANLELDLYRPIAASAPRPGLVFVHGGGWHAGQREQFSWHAEQCAQRGYVCVSISYRLTGAAPYPACLDDCQRAVRWLRSRAGEFNLDPERIGAFGSSAGGHLVACLGVRDTRSERNDELAEYSSRVQCVVDYHGIHDFPALPDWKLASEACEALFGGPLQARRELWEDASPVRFVDAETAPMLLIHDPDDPTVPYAQSVDFAAALMAVGRPVEFMPVLGAGHGFGYNPENLAQRRTWPVALSWLRRWLKPGH